MSSTSRSTTRTSSGPVLPISSAFQRAAPPSAGGLYSSSASGSGFASYSSSFSARSSPIFPHRSASPTRVHLIGAAPMNPSVRFSLDRRPTSPGRSFAVADRVVKKPVAPARRRRTCTCSPTSHPGSFRCGLHKGLNGGPHHGSAGSSPSIRLNMRRSAMTNSLVRIGTVEGDLVKRALAALIRPCAHQQRRRADFQPRPSRLSVMSNADDL